MGPSSRTVQTKDAFLPLLTAVFAAAALTWAGSSPARGEEPLEAKCTAPVAAASDPAASTIQVTVDNVRNSKGLITAVLYSDDPETFLKSGKRLDRIRVEAHEGETVLCLEAPANGRYSVALYHDENGNKKFDRDFLGIPTEGYGFSQNPGFRFGKPELEETLFSIDSGLTSLRISILYLQG
ncbi:DUF2141 domain-containing protein [Pelagibius sp. CAU 1746]|uniref:DUF2141 domain-containing protein n=1 Tax=Pelagibius sp. CAU 1746 TaxID=3140370 RepID=UPI00325BF4F9